MQTYFRGRAKTADPPLDQQLAKFSFSIMRIGSHTVPAPTSAGNREGGLVMESNRRVEGCRAFNRGIERDRCPHAPGSASFKEWVEGWKLQKAEFEKRLVHEREAMHLARAS